MVFLLHYIATVFHLHFSSLVYLSCLCYLNSLPSQCSYFTLLLFCFSCISLSYLYPLRFFHFFYYLSLSFPVALLPPVSPYVMSISHYIASFFCCFFRFSFIIFFLFSFLFCCLSMSLTYKNDSLHALHISLHLLLFSAVSLVFLLFSSFLCILFPLPFCCLSCLFLNSSSHSLHDGLVLYISYIFFACVPSIFLSFSSFVLSFCLLSFNNHSLSSFLLFSCLSVT